MNEQIDKYELVVHIPQDFEGTAKKPSLTKVQEYCESIGLSFVEDVKQSFNTRYFFHPVDFSTLFTFYFYIVLCHDKNMETRNYTIYKYPAEDIVSKKLNVNDISGKKDLLKYLDNVPVNDNVLSVVITYNMEILKPEEVIRPFITKLGLELIIKINDHSKNADVRFRLDRKYFTKNFTLGELFKNNDKKRYCYILEDRVRFSTEECKRFDPKIHVDETSKLCKNKVPALTAIPCGTYKVQNIGSNKFKCTMNGRTYHAAPKLLTLYGHEPPCFKYIAMHSGATAGWSEGCILMTSKILDKKYGLIENDGQALMDDIYATIHNGYGLIEITQKVNGKDLTKEDIDKIKNGAVLGDIIVE
jgi:hypothetical protein